MYSIKPREKMIEKGASALTDAELLAVVIRTGYSGVSAYKVAKEILKQRSLVDLFQMKSSQLSLIKGIGKSKATALLAGAELYRRINYIDLMPTIKNAQDVVTLTHAIIEKKQEHLVGIYLNARNELIKKKIITIGTLDASLIHPREIFSYALSFHAARIIIVHNHPSGNPEPSREDIIITKQLIKAGRLLGIELIDHVILGSNKYFSFREKYRTNQKLLQSKTDDGKSKL
ncbi:DNA repair protein RadC [candidate division WWE3 bacterium]|nr:DNA repair protein RadC [candidate division WWE3 bacterium]